MKHDIFSGLEHLATEVTDLVEDPENARQHTTRSVDAVAESLTQFGQRKPIIVRKETNIVTAGNGTLQAAKKLGWTHIAALFIDEDKARSAAFAIADNRTAELSAWDDDALAAVLTYLSKDPSVDYLEATGFSNEELEKMLPELGDPLEGFEPSEDLIDGIDLGGDSPSSPTGRAGVKVQVGEYRFEIPGGVYDDWKTRTAENVGFEKTAFHKAIARALALSDTTVSTYTVDKELFRGKGKGALDRA